MLVPPFAAFKPNQLGHVLHAVCLIRRSEEHRGGIRTEGHRSSFGKMLPGISELLTNRDTSKYSAARVQQLSTFPSASREGQGLRSNSFLTSHSNASTPSTHRITSPRTARSPPRSVRTNDTRTLQILGSVRACAAAYPQHAAFTRGVRGVHARCALGARSTLVADGSPAGCNLSHSIYG